MVLPFRIKNGELKIELTEVFEPLLSQLDTKALTVAAALANRISSTAFWMSSRGATSPM
jgi:hypothetical protein